MNRSLLTGLAVGGAFGFVLGAFAQRKKLESTFEVLVESEISKLQSYYSSLHKTSYDTPQEAAADLIPEEVLETVTAVRRENKPPPKRKPVDYTRASRVVEEPKDDVVTPEPVVQNVFEQMIFDPEQPHAITMEEYLANETGFQQGTLMFYAEENVLLDEDETPFGDHEPIVGGITRENFGVNESSDDDSLVMYVRNPKLHMEYEIYLCEKALEL